MMRHSRSPFLAGYLAAMLGFAPLSAPMTALANPQNGNVAAGTATISGQGSSHVIVNQSSDRAVINWQTFNIGETERTQFIQPGASSIALNRVTGNLGPSTILGSIDANGRVFLVNPDGILFGSTAVINTAGFLATTHDITDADFMAGRNNFTIPGKASASIVNLGTITATNAGIAALVAPGVRNSGIITAELGKVALASNNGFTLDFYGDKLITMQVDGVVASQVKDVQTNKTLAEMAQDGATDLALVKNEGSLRANGGRVELTAAAARQVVDAVINNSGVIEANSVGTKNGMIVLGAATASTKGAVTDTQKVKVSGTLSASGKNAGEKGGKIQITGENIALNSAKLDASGKGGGGTVLVGGEVSYFDRASTSVVAAPTNTSTTVTIDAASVIDVSGQNLIPANEGGSGVLSGAGSGGRIGIWADQSNSVAGNLLATGGMSGGFGGEIFVAALTGLAFSGATDTRGFYSESESGPTHGWTYLGADGDVTIGNSGASFVMASAIASSLANGNVQVLAGLPSGDEPTISNLTVADSISWATNTHLWLSATHHLAIADGVSIANTYNSLAVGWAVLPKLTLQAGLAGTGGGTVSFGEDALVDFSASIGTVDVWHNPARDELGTRLSVAGNILMSGDGKSSRVTEYWWINTVTDLQNIYMDLGANYALSRDIDATATATADWDNGFIPIGLESENPEFQGRLLGLGHTIYGLTINSSASNVGLFSVIGANGLVSDVHLQNVNVIAANGVQNAGALAGTNYGTITGSSASGTLGNTSASETAHGGFGGLVGSNEYGGSIDQSWASVAVTVHGPTSGYTDAGGLVGVNSGDISRSYATGSVTGASYSSSSGTYLGGLVGWNTGGTISDSYATGDVSGTGAFGTAGGFVGVNTGSIAKAYALGSVSLTGDDSTAGGFVGTNSYDGSIDNAFSTGFVTASGLNSQFGGFAGLNDGTISASFWDTDTSGTTIGVGGEGNSEGLVGLSTALAYQSSSYDWDFTNTWFIVEGATRPFLRSEWSITVTNAHQLQLMTLNPSANYKLANDIGFAGLFTASGMWNPDKGFVPIGSTSGWFTGFFDGQGYSISGLTITPEGNYNGAIGLFSTIGAGGVVRNLDIVDAYVAANRAYEGNQVIGVLAGQNAGTIDNVSVSGTVDGMPYDGETRSDISGVVAGGLVGQNGINSEDTAMAGTILGSRADVTVTVGSGNSSWGWNVAGGLVGANVFGSTISSSWAEGAVTGGSYSSLGGLVGQNGWGGSYSTTGYIVNSAAFGDVSSDGVAVMVGGLVGLNAAGSWLTNSYAQGDVTATGTVTADNGDCGANGNCTFVSAGGLVGQNQGIIQGSWLESMLPGSWLSESSYTYNYNSYDPQTYYGATYASGNVLVGSNATGGGLVGQNFGMIAGAFALGNVDGAAGTAATAGVFDNNTRLGGLVGTNQGIIDSSFADGTVGSLATAYLNAGGLVSENSGTIMNSFAFGDVLAGDHSVVGGLAADSTINTYTCAYCTLGMGYNNDAFILLSSAFGNVTAGSGSVAGGLVGHSDSLNAGVAALGSVTVGDNSIAGGLIGVLDVGGSLTSGYAYGETVSSTGANSIIGGLVGVNAGLISGAESWSNVSGTSNSYVGGLVGINLKVGNDPYSGVIYSASVDPSVSGSGSGNVVGGLLGFNSGTADGGTVYADVSSGANSIVGALAGLSGATSITNYTFTGSVSGNSDTTTLPAVPSWLSGCSDAICTALMQVPLTQFNPPPTTDIPIDIPTNVTNQVQPTTTTDPNTGNTINLTQSESTGGSSTGGAGGQGGGQGGNGGTGNNPPPPPTGPPPGPGIGRTLSEQKFSGVPPLTETRFLPGEVVVQVSNTISPERIQEVARQLGISIVASQAIDGSGRVVYRFSTSGGKDIRDVIRALEKQQIVASAQPNYVFGLAEAVPARRAASTTIPLPRPAPMRMVQSAAPPPVMTPTPDVAPAVDAVPAHEPWPVTPVPAAAADATDATGALPPTPELSSDLQSDMASRTTGLPTGDAGQYIIDKLRLGAVHSRALGRNVTVAVIDSEIDTQHPDLAGVVSDRFDATGAAPSPHAHGTGMAGAIASHRRLLGIAPGVRILAVKAFDETNTSAEATSFQILKGLDWAIAKRPRIINMSFAGPRDLMLERAMQKAYDAGIVLIAAAGNAGPKSPPLYPAADVNVIAVSASDYADKPFAMANRGKHIAVAAPGVDVLVPSPKGGYQLTTGTSVAAAHVSGVAALLLEGRPGLTPKDVRRILTSTAKPVNVRGGAETFGAGIVDPFQALSTLTARSVDAAPARAVH